MLKVKFNKYEIEEKLELENTKGEVIGILDIKITPSEFKILKAVIINEQTMDLAKQIQANNTFDFKQAETESKKIEEAIIKKVIKDKKQFIIDNGGEAGLESVVETINDFLLDYLKKKGENRLNTMNINR